MTALAADRLPVSPTGGARVRAPLLGACALVACAALGLWVASESQRDWPAPAVVPVAVGEQHYRLRPQQLPELAGFTERHFTDGAERTRERLATEVDAGLDAVIERVRGRLPEFADWYYSLGGEYSRLSMAALSRLNLADGNHLADRASTMLFPDGEWQRQLTALDRDLVTTLRSEQDALRAGWLAALEQRLSASRVPAPLHTADRPREAEPLQPQQFARDLVAREQAALESRAVASTAVGGSAAAATAVWRAAAARTAARSGRLAAARGAGRGLARAGSAAGSGFALCAPGGPAAAGCALVAGAAAWLATDWALLRVDEAMHRDELLAALDASLDALAAELRADLLANYDEVLARYQAGVEEDIAWTFSPARAR